MMNNGKGKKGNSKNKDSAVRGRSSEPYLALPASEQWARERSLSVCPYRDDRNLGMNPIILESGEIDINMSTNPPLNIEDTPYEAGHPSTQPPSHTPTTTHITHNTVNQTDPEVVRQMTQAVITSVADGVHSASRGIK